MEKSSAEWQLELQNKLASLQMSNDNLTTELSRKEHQLTEVIFTPASMLINKQAVICVLVLIVE